MELIDKFVKYGYDKFDNCEKMFVSVFVFLQILIKVGFNYQ